MELGEEHMGSNSSSLLSSMVAVGKLFTSLFLLFFICQVGVTPTFEELL